MLDPLTWRRAWVAYVAAHIGKSLLWTASDLLPVYMLVSVYGVDPTIAGALFFGGLAVNALADLVVGIWLDRRPRHAARLAGSALTLAALTFPATALLAPWGPWSLLAATLVFRVVYAGCDVPHNALLTRLGGDPARAAWLVRGRMIGTALASFLAALGAGDAVRLAPAPFLWGIAGAALLLGSAMVPLLAAYPPMAGVGTDRVKGVIGTPPRLLAATVVGILGLGALGKAALHLPGDLAAARDGALILDLLIAGRTAAALIPCRIGSVRHGCNLLAISYAASAVVAVGFVWSAAPAMLIALGFAMGATNLVGWVLLPTLGVGPRGFGIYTMVSKLALGASGLALAAGLTRAPVFTSAGFARFAITAALATGIAALLAGPRVTWGRGRGFSSP